MEFKLVVAMVLLNELDSPVVRKADFLVAHHIFITP